MYQIIKIGDQDVPMRSSAATQYRFKAVFGTDLMSALSRANKSPENQTEAAELIPQLGYIMAKQADNSTEWRKLNFEAFLEWADQYDTSDMAIAAPEIVQIYSSSARTTSTPKNPGGAPSGR